MCQIGLDTGRQSVWVRISDIQAGRMSQNIPDAGRQYGSEYLRYKQVECVRMGQNI